MAVEKPVAVPKKEITSIDVGPWTGGLNLNGPQNAPVSSFMESKDAELSIDGYLTNRRVLRDFLPATVETVYQILPVNYGDKFYYFTADENKLKYCQEGDAAWSVCGGDNTIHTQNGGRPKLLRVLDCVMLLNGSNGDKLCYVDMSQTGFPVVKYTPVADPTAAPTAAPTNLANSGSFKVYYAYSYSTDAGETLLSPILSYTVDTTRDMWKTKSSPGWLVITRPGSAPAGAKFWNLYVALAATGGTIQSSDMLQLAVKLDLSISTFTDDGTLDINLGAPAPLANSTDGMYVDHGIVEDGNPILFGDKDNPQAIYIGGGGPYAMSFSVSNGGYKAEPEKGTNFRPTAIIGFRNGQGIPSLTVLYSNTEGIAKQSVLAQQNVTYGNQTFSVWGVTSQHYGAAGVAATDSAVNYNGKLLFLSTDGMMSMNTQPLRQNVIATDPVSMQTIDAYIRRIKNEAMDKVVGTGWDNKFMFTIPSDGFDEPRQILIMDDNNKVQDQSAWYTLDIPAQWVGVVTPPKSAAFVYVCQGNRSYKLVPGSGTYDTKGGVPVPFSTKATGPLISMGGPAHNHWQADVQVMFYVMGLVGEITVGVRYQDQNNRPKVKTKTYVGPSFHPSAAGGWADPGWTYAGFPMVLGWGSEPLIDSSVASVESADVRIPVQIDDIMNEAQWFYSTPVGFNKYKIKAISFEGINLGVRPDLQ